MIRRSRSLAVGIVAATVAAAVPAFAASPLQTRVQSARSFAFAIGDGAAGRDLSRYDLVVVDGADTTPRRVAQLKRQGAIVLAYVSVGTIERGRSWYPAAAQYRMELWGDWGEWYARVADPGYRTLVTGRVAPWMLRKGFDGLFLDNVDMIDTHPGQRTGMIDLVRRLGRLTHARGRLLFTQNGAGVMGPMRGAIDGWNREDVTATYDFDTGTYRAVPPADTQAAVAELRAMRRAGKVVTATDYMTATNTAARARAVQVACSAGALPFTSDIFLRRMARVPLRCPG